MNYCTYIWILSKENIQWFDEIDFDSWSTFIDNNITNDLKQNWIFFFKTIWYLQWDLFENIIYLWDNLKTGNEIFENTWNENFWYNFLLFLEMEEILKKNNLWNKEDIEKLYKDWFIFAITQEKQKYMLYWEKVKNILLWMIDIFEEKNKDANEFLNSI